jgi:hypothetical protein
MRLILSGVEAHNRGDIRVHSVADVKQKLVDGVTPGLAPLQFGLIISESLPQIAAKKLHLDGVHKC